MLGSEPDYTMLLSRSSLSKRAAAFATAAMIFTGPAFAQQAHVTPVAAKSEQVTLNTDCNTRSTNKEIFGDVKCEVLKGVVLDSANASLDKEIACKRLIISAAKDGKITLTGVPGPGEACKMAKKFGLS